MRKSLVFADSRKIYSADSGTGASIAVDIGADRSVSDKSLRMFSGELPAAGAAILRAGTAAQRVLLPTRPGALQGLWNGVDRVLLPSRVVAIGRGHVFKPALEASDGDCRVAQAGEVARRVAHAPGSGPRRMSSRERSEGGSQCASARGGCGAACWNRP